MVEGYTVKFLFQSISWNTLLEVFHGPWNTFMKYFYFSISVSLRMFLVDIKNCVYREKISSDSENLLTLILINNICCSKQRKKKKPTKGSSTTCFHVDFAKCFRISTWQNTCKRLLLEYTFEVLAVSMVFLT